MFSNFFDFRNAFVSVEKAYIENYDGMIAERTSLQYRLQTLTESQVMLFYLFCFIWETNNIIITIGNQTIQ